MIVTLLTDFGTADYYVGALKGALLSVNPSAVPVDITHDIAPHDVEAAAFTLLAAFETFPAGTVHVAVIDPGVGSSRRGLVVSGGGHFFVGPDNGVFGHVYERLNNFQAFQLKNETYFRPNVSATFHGRDVFAPVAGTLSRGVRPEEMGPEVFDFVRLPLAAPAGRVDGSLVGAVIHVDRFGNCVTNISPEDLAGGELGRGARLRVGRHFIRSVRSFYAEEGPGGAFAIWGSAGLLEISVFRDSAARALGVRRGDVVEVLAGEGEALGGDASGESL